MLRFLLVFTNVTYEVLRNDDAFSRVTWGSEENWISKIVWSDKENLVIHPTLSDGGALAHWAATNMKAHLVKKTMLRYLSSKNCRRVNEKWKTKTDL